jgi:hypothetical protein
MALTRSSFSKITSTPPRKGPKSKGLNIKYKKATTITAEKLNGRNRQDTTKRIPKRKST